MSGVGGDNGPVAVQTVYRGCWCGRRKRDSDGHQWHSVGKITKSQRSRADALDGVDEITAAILSLCDNCDCGTV